ncbi:hypothetical protein [Flectobacillus roseus]|uniref:Uncharacterized protein n=1 Tax=Flectobacillus roseus TaxID=502259 RepID=A0ABT6Y6A2_9BACT|nr:hypothetical protein [Flectobacillus roseus]MDI9858984.1 hypothetical protein [Flectobacillus roseus]
MEKYFYLKRLVLVLSLSLIGITNQLKGQTVDLTTHAPTSSPPSGATFEWHNALPVSPSNIVANPAAASPGLYYGVYNLGSCYSEAAPLRVASNDCSTGSTGVDLRTLVDSTDKPLGTIVTYHTGLPASSSNRITGPSITSATANTYYAAYYDVTNQCFSSESVLVILNTVCNGQVTAKVFLQGAFNTTTNTMTKALNTQNLIPLTDPYNLGATTTTSVLTANEITDWVRVELRTGTNGATIQESIAALVAVDGSLYNPDGTTPLKFQATSGNYYVAIRHRNHLGIMTASTITLSSNVPVVDFTSPSTSTFGTNGSATIGSIKALWAGNATGLTVAGTDNVRYSSGDINAVTGYLTTQTGSAGGVKVSVYTKEDTNLDGIVRYSGATRDILPINNTILTHPGNTLQTLGFIVTQTF